MTKSNFYETEEWRSLRYQVLRFYEGRCMLCGDSGHWAALQVDHIKPRSKYPELALDFNNLQVLCKACNYGKSNVYEDDWRVQAVLPVLDRERLKEFWEKHG